VPYTLQPCHGPRATHAQGLLNKKPSDRLGWPALLDHPFVRETEGERLAREKMLADATEIAESSRAWKVCGCAVRPSHDCGPLPSHGQTMPQAQPAGMSLQEVLCVSRATGYSGPAARVAQTASSGGCGCCAFVLRVIHAHAGAAYIAPQGEGGAVAGAVLALATGGMGSDPRAGGGQGGGRASIGGLERVMRSIPVFAIHGLRLHERAPAELPEGHARHACAACLLAPCTHTVHIHVVHILYTYTQYTY
jgi:hypothetical protein